MFLHKSVRYFPPSPPPPVSTRCAIPLPWYRKVKPNCGWAKYLPDCSSRWTHWVYWTLTLRLANQTWYSGLASWARNKTNGECHATLPEVRCCRCSEATACHTRPPISRPSDLSFRKHAAQLPWSASPRCVPLPLPHTLAPMPSRPRSTYLKAIGHFRISRCSSRDETPDIPSNPSLAVPWLTL